MNPTKEVLMSKVWLITGSSRGLGRALAEAVLAAGHRLVATARNPEQFSDLVERYRDRICAVALDVADDRAATMPFSRCRRLRRVDVLVNNAGYAMSTRSRIRARGLSRADRDQPIGVIIVTKAAIPLMRDKGQGTSSSSPPSAGWSERWAARPIPPPSGAT